VSKLLGDPRQHLGGPLRHRQPLEMLLTGLPTRPAMLDAVAVLDLISALGVI
jgi:hypothetical protein